MAKTLQGTKQVHAARAEAAMGEVRKNIASARKAIRDGSCTRAYMAVTQVWEKLGVSRGNSEHVGGTPWFPESEMRELGYEFSQRCLRDEPTSLSGPRGSRFKRKP